MKELIKLKQLNMAVSDYLFGLRCDEFADYCGGIDDLFKCVVDIHNEYEALYNTMHDECD